MELSRRPTEKEINLLRLLIIKSEMDFSENWENNLLVSPMKDGEMGSLYLYPSGTFVTNRKFGKQVSEYQYKDQDGVDVMVALNIDDNNDLYELDIWKVDFSKLITLPHL